MEELKRLVADVEIPLSLQGFGITEEALESLADDAVKQQRLLARSPRPLERDDIYAIYRNAFEGAVKEKS